MKTRARHTIVTYRRSNISTQFSRGHSLRTNLAPRQSRSIINATLEGVGDYPSLGHAVFALLEFPSRFDLSLSFSPPPTPPFRSKDLSAARNNKVPEWKATDTVSNVVYINRLAFLLQRSKRKFSSYDSRYRIKFWKRENRSRLLSLCKIYVFTYGYGIIVDEIKARWFVSQFPRDGSGSRHPATYHRWSAPYRLSYRFSRLVERIENCY